MCRRPRSWTAIHYYTCTSGAPSRLRHSIQCACRPLVPNSRVRGARARGLELKRCSLTPHPGWPSAGYKDVTCQISCRSAENWGCEQTDRQTDRHFRFYMTCMYAQISAVHKFRRCDSLSNLRSETCIQTFMYSSPGRYFLPLSLPTVPQCPSVGKGYSDGLFRTDNVQKNRNK